MTPFEGLARRPVTPPHALDQYRQPHAATNPSSSDDDDGDIFVIVVVVFIVQSEHLRPTLPLLLLDHLELPLLARLPLSLTATLQPRRRS